MKLYTNTADVLPTKRRIIRRFCRDESKRRLLFILRVRDIISTNTTKGMVRSYDNRQEYRSIQKEKGLTQEELGERLGVTNQAVSKWENETTLPDVMLLPRIAQVLCVTLNALYGITEDRPQKVRADDFPRAAREMLKDYFVKQAGARMPGGSELGESVDVFGCVSDTAGAVFISKNFSFVENTFRMPGSEAIYERVELVSFLKKLADQKALKVLAYMYRTAVERHTSDPDTEGWGGKTLAFTLSSVAEECSLEIDEALETIEKLTALHLITDKWIEDGVTEYYFSMDNAQFVLVIFRALNLLFAEDRCYSLWRDTSRISDYLFEKLWQTN